MIKRAGLTLAAALLLAGCGLMDLNSFEDRLDSLEKRVATVEEQVSTMNSDVAVLSQIVDKMGKTTILTVDTVEEGYIIHFSDGSSLNVRHGHDGNDGSNGTDGHSPQVGVRQDTDGFWYWTLDGGWLLDSTTGGKVRANGIDGTDGTDGTNGTDGVTPLITVEDGWWMVSTDNGEHWTKIAEYAASSTVAPLISSIDYTTESDTVIFILSDNTVLRFPRKGGLMLAFDYDSITVAAPGAQCTVSYTLSGGTQNNSVKAFAQGGWIASVTPLTAYAGTITLTAPDPVTSCDVVVIANDGAGYSVLAAINCVKGTLNVADSWKAVSPGGGEVEFPLSTDIDYVVESEAPWLAYTATKGDLRDETIVVQATANTGVPRVGSVRLLQNGAVAASVIVFQGGKLGLYPTEGEAVVYQRKKYQISILDGIGMAGDRFSYRMVDLAAGAVVEIGPLPQDIKAGTSCNGVQLNRYSEGVKVCSETHDLQVLTKVGDLITLLAEDMSCFTIRYSAL